MRLRLQLVATVVALSAVPSCSAEAPQSSSDGTWVGTITAEGNVTTVINESGSVWGGTATLVEEASIGVESGPALVGNVGSSDHIEYTALGDVVNMASRYEKLNKRFKTRILFSKTVKEAVEDLLDDAELQFLGEHDVRGVEGKRPFFTLKDFGE